MVAQNPPPSPSRRGLFSIMGDSINLDGHRVPISVLALLVTVAGIILVLRARASGSNLVSAGTASPAGATAGYDASAGAIADLQGQYTFLAQELAQLNGTDVVQQTSQPSPSPVASSSPVVNPNQAWQPTAAPMPPTPIGPGTSPTAFPWVQNPGMGQAAGLHAQPGIGGPGGIEAASQIAGVQHVAGPAPLPASPALRGAVG